MSGPLTCSCCGDSHEDIDPYPESPTYLLCFLCQPCPECGESGGDCDPYAFDSGRQGCVNAARWAGSGTP